MKRTWKRPFVAALLLIATAMIATGTMKTLYSYESFRVDIPTKEAKILTGKLFIPSSAPEEKSPGILISHGANNEYSAMEAYAAKLASSGCTVLLFNQYNHGQSSIAETPSMGTSDALKYLYDLDFVDKERIGAIGHTMGGYYLSIAAEETGIPLSAVLNIDYIDISGSLMRLYNHTDNLGFILARYDEHQRSGSLEDTENRLSALYGKEERTENGIVYTDGVHTAYLDTENINTSLLPAFPGALDTAVAFFSRTLGYEVQPSLGLNTVFQLKSILQIILFTALTVLLIPVLFPEERMKEEKSGEKKGILITSLASVAIYAVLPPLYMIGKKLLMPNSIFPETDTNGLVIWAVFTGFILIAISLFRGNITAGRISDDLGRGCFKAAFVFATLYMVNLIIIWLTESNIFILFANLSPFTKRKMLAWIVYLPFFLAGFTGFSLFTSEYAGGRHALLKHLLFYIAGPVFIIAVFFLGFPIKGELFLYNHRFAMIPVIYMLPFTPLFALVDYYGQKRSQSIAFPAILNTLIFSWLFVASNALYILL